MMNKFLKPALLALFSFVLLFACGDGGDGTGGGKSASGESCTKTEDCTSGLKCLDQKCVRDENGSNGDTSTTGDGTGTDGGSTNSGNLTWQNPPAENSMTWQEAIDYCTNLTQDGGGWRLPTISELRSLIRGCEATQTGGSCGVTDDCLSYSSCWSDTCSGCSYSDGPADGCYWPSDMQGPCQYYWSSSSGEDDDDYAWNVGFSYGYVGSLSKGLSNGVVRCVR